MEPRRGDVGGASGCPRDPGHFELGDTGFSSDYASSPGSNTTEGQYTVRSNPFPWNGLFISAGDHTPGQGLMYVGNGSPVDGAVVWQSVPFAVATNTDYFFEAFVMSVSCSSPCRATRLRSSSSWCRASRSAS